MSFSFRNPAYSFYERRLMARILAGEPVEHVAIIQDGNRRYARQRGLSKFLGHSLGAETSEKVPTGAWSWVSSISPSMPFLRRTLRGMRRRRRYLFDLIKKKFMDLNHSKKIHANKVRVRAIGRVEMLPEDLQRGDNAALRRPRETMRRCTSI